MPQLAYDAVLCDIDAERLGTQADRCLFVDDTADNVVAARAADDRPPLPPPRRSPPGALTAAQHAGLPGGSVLNRRRRQRPRPAARETRHRAAPSRPVMRQLPQDQSPL